MGEREPVLAQEQALQCCSLTWDEGGGTMVLLGKPRDYPFRAPSNGPPRIRILSKTQVKSTP